jgi:cysteine synthase A
LSIHQRSGQATTTARSTPLVPIQLGEGDSTIWCKLEFLNPSGSTKDRIASFILDKALAEHRILRGHTVVEASSGSTSIAFALACAQRELPFIAVMPEGVSNERVLMIRALGGDVRFTPHADGVLGAIAESERLGREVGGFLPCQFSNPDNTLAHEIWTAAEILSQVPGSTVDAVVSGVGTGGTLVGLYRGLRKANVDVLPVLARPVEISEELEPECYSFSSQIPGVVDGVSKLFQAKQFPNLVTIDVPQDCAIETARQLIRRGFPVGPSSGLNYAAAVMAARQMESDARIVTVFPDRMERYFTTKLFNPYR